MNITVFFKKICLWALACALIFSCLSCNENNYSVPETPEENKQKYPTVIIDAGHGGEDCGAIGINGVYEKDLNLIIALELQGMLQANEIPTRLTRETDTLLYDKNTDYHGKKKILDMQARRAIINQYPNAIFISIHMNSFPEQKYSGLQIYYSPCVEKSRILAQFIQDTVHNNLQYDNDRQIKSSEDNIYLLNEAIHPSILIECGFLSNREECELLCQTAYQKRLTLCIYTAIINYFTSEQNNNESNT